MLDYIIQVLLFQTLFLAVYDLFLKKETFFQWNRGYLLITSIAAYCIPMIKVNSIQKIVPQEYIIELPEIMLSPTAVIKDNFDWSSLFFDALQWVFWIGVILMIILFLLKLTNLIRLIHENEKIEKNRYQIVFLKSDKAFSFFKYIFLGKDVDKKNKEQIIEHELVHVEQKHTLDLLFFEFQKIICWFNPFSYLFQHRIAELHEFIADSKTVKDVNKKDYFQNLLSQTFGTHKISFINSFLKISLIKKRIIMLNKHKSKQILKFKYILMLPLLVSMLLYSSCEKDIESQQTIKTNEKRLITLYLGSRDGLELRESKSEKEGYFDMYMLGATPEGREISYIDLLEEEKLEYDEIDTAFTKFKDFASLMIFENEQGKKSLKQVFDWSKRKKRTIEDSVEGDEIPFAAVINPPIFPGCEDAEDKKQCFNLNLQKYVARNFDASLSKGLGLEPGKKKIYVQFKIDKEGNVIDAKSRAPHKALETEAIKLVNGLPKMTPGKHKGKYVNVTYMLPINFRIE